LEEDSNNRPEAKLAKMSYIEDEEAFGVFSSGDQKNTKSGGIEHILKAGAGNSQGMDEEDPNQHIQGKIVDYCRANPTRRGSEGQCHLQT
jgi:hypothetical protein